MSGPQSSEVLYDTQVSEGRGWPQHLKNFLPSWDPDLYPMSEERSTAKPDPDHLQTILNRYRALSEQDVCASSSISTPEQSTIDERQTDYAGQFQRWVQLLSSENMLAHPPFFVVLDCGSSHPKGWTMVHESGNDNVRERVEKGVPAFTVFSSHLSLMRVFNPASLFNLDTWIITDLQNTELDNIMLEHHTRLRDAILALLDSAFAVEDLFKRHASRFQLLNSQSSIEAEEDGSYMSELEKISRRLLGGPFFRPLDHVRDLLMFNMECFSEKAGEKSFMKSPTEISVVGPANVEFVVRGTRHVIPVVATPMSGKTSIVIKKSMA